eukprot:gene2032-1539_t
MDLLDSLIEDAKKKKLISISNFRKIKRKFIEIVSEESNCIQIHAPANIVGKLSGKFDDLMSVLSLKNLPKTQYLFLGNYVNKHYDSVEVFTMLVLCKVKYPKNVFLLRGNHEETKIGQVYGFYDECFRKYGDYSFFKDSIEIFDYLSLCALVNGKLFCVNGGLSPDIKTIEKINTLDRVKNMGYEGPIIDLLWSDPEEGLDNWAVNPRGAGVLNGTHLVLDGMIQRKKGTIINISSVSRIKAFPNHSTYCGTKAAVCLFTETLRQEVASSGVRVSVVCPV